MDITISITFKFPTAENYPAAGDPTILFTDPSDFAVDLADWLISSAASPPEGVEITYIGVPQGER